MFPQAQLARACARPNRQPERVRWTGQLSGPHVGGPSVFHSYKWAQPRAAFESQRQGRSMLRPAPVFSEKWPPYTQGPRGDIRRDWFEQLVDDVFLRVSRIGLDAESKFVIIPASSLAATPQADTRRWN